MKRFITILLAAVIALPLVAQHHKKQDEKSFKDKVEATKAAYFTEKIGLTPEEAQRFWPVYYKWWGERQEAYKKVHQSMDAIVALDEKGGYTDPQMKKLINEYTQNLSLEAEIFEMYLDEFYKILPTDKVAKIFVAEKGFRKILTELWKENRHPKGPAPEGKETPHKHEQR